MAVFKVSIVVPEDPQAGTILNLEKRPAVGDILRLPGGKYKVLEVIELMPPRGDFHFLHLTCQPGEN